MRHADRMADERFDPSQALGKRKNFETTYYFIYIGSSAFKLKRDHATKTAHLAFCQLIIRMRGQARIVDLLNAWMLRETVGNGPGILFMLAHAYRQGFDSP